MRPETRNMAQLLVRNLDEDLVVALRKRAAKNGRSAEAELRAILRAALRSQPTRDFKTTLLSMPKSQSEEDEADFALERDLGRGLELG